MANPRLRGYSDAGFENYFRGDPDGQIRRHLGRRPRRSPGRGLPRLSRPGLPRPLRRAPEDDGRAASRDGPRRQRVPSEWEEETGGDGGLTAALRLRARATRCSTRRASPPRCCSPTPTCSAPDGSRRRRSGRGWPARPTTRTRRSPAAGPTTAGSPTSCARNPERRIGVAVDPRSSPTSTPPSPRCARRSELGLRGILIPTRWFDQPAYHDPRYEPVWAARRGARPRAAHALGRGPDRLRPRPGHACRSTPPRPGWWAARPLWVLLWGGVFERHPEPEVLDRRERRLVGARPSIRKMDEKWIGGHNTRKFGDAFRKDCRRKPSEYLDRNCFFAASTPGRRRDRPPPPHRHRQPDVGQRPPAPRGHVPPHPLLDPTSGSTTSPRTRPRRILGLTAAERLRRRPRARWRHSPTASARPLDEVHGDAPLRARSRPHV